MVCAVLFSSNPETVGTLYSVDPRIWDQGPGDPGIRGLGDSGQPGTHGSENLGLELAYTIHVHT